MTDREEPKSGFRALIGYEVVEWRDGRAVFELALDARHINRGGLVHGGVLMTLLDAAAGYAGCYCAFPGRARRCLTLNFNISFVGLAKPGLLRAIGTVRGGGTRIFHSTAEVLDSGGALVAMGTGSFRYRTGSEKPEGVPL